jgi:hypothetical protein
MRPHRLLRLAAVGSIAASLAHFLVPGVLLRTAAWGYDRVLAVEFRPREHATRRVRLLGLVFLVAGLVGLRLGGD